MKKIYKLLVLITTIFLIAYLVNCTNNSADRAAQDQRKALLITLATTAGINCPNPTPSFSSLALAGTVTSCASSGCHSTNSAQSGLDMTTYSSVKQRTVSGNPVGSLLYQKITTGTMVQNSNGAINVAIYCWIKGGVNP